jgi:hypothetical protein
MGIAGKISKKAKRWKRQLELLKNFEGDFYQEKKIGNEWYVKMWNGGTARWQVAIFTEEKFRKYKGFANVAKEEEEMENQFKESIL